MQRTYRSKKDAPGGLEPPEVLLSVDDKTSAFDAFFIQSIKQIKRELSCVGPRNQQNVTRKVRKRKYVRRIVKDIEPTLLDSSTRKSTYLTPDKSFRVNKPQDLFDQLLNSSSYTSNLVTVTTADDLFSQLHANEPKSTYARKIYRNKMIRKFNCSSDTSSDSEKEITWNNSPLQNVTDIRKHEFIIEKEKKESPICPDDSIIVQDLSMIKKLGNNVENSKQSKEKEYKKHRLTKNLKSPNMLNSPQCSTPFMQKYRSKSIYNFSPISHKLDDTVNGDNCDPSVNNCNDLNVLHPIGGDEEITSPHREIVNEQSIHHCIDDSLEEICTDNNLQVLDISPKGENLNTDNSEKGTDVKNMDSSNSIQDSNEINPFLGFSNQSQGWANLQNFEKFLRNTSKINNNADQSPVFHVSKKCLSRVSLRKKNSTEKSVRKSSMKANQTEDNIEDPNLEMSVQIEPFIGFSETTIAKDYINTEGRNSESDVSAIVETTILECFPTKLRKTSPTIDLTSSEDDFNSASDNESLDTGNGSYYDTCSSDSDEVVQKKTKIRKIFMDRMDNFLFLDRYYKRKMEEQTDSSTSSSYSERKKKVNNTNQDNYQDMVDQSDMENRDSHFDDEIPYTDIELNTYTRYEKSSTKDDDVEKHISFVTTRKRNVADNSIPMLLDECRRSVSSDEWDQVLSKFNRENEELIEVNEELDISTVRRSLDQTVTVSEDEIPEFNNPDIATKTFDDKAVIEANNDKELIRNVNTSYSEDKEKPVIVLQRGKKWERSLSIYRRMTMMDETLLEDADLKNKGRKYRQSVISTMEMQDRGPLHNESVCSRRNTIVQKQHRSTIRIVKEPNIPRVSLNTTAVYDDLTGFLSEDCDDTLVELSKLSIADEHEITVLGKVDDPPERVTSARDYVLRRCEQTDVLQFDECYPETLMKNCHKIGEGVYGEVYLYRARDGVRVMKIVPVAGDTVVNGEPQKDFHEIISEIVIAMELSALRAPIPDVEFHLQANTYSTLDLNAIGNATDVFNEVLAVRCVTGPYPTRLLELWELYDECKGSENDNPAALPADQQYIVLELANAGHDLESYQFDGAEQAHALFLQVAFGLAVAEEAFQFEHRDLHWGNVLVAPTNKKHARFVLRGRAYRVPRRGVAATIIDYSLSRLALPLAGEERAALFNDLSKDDGLFGATGDYQFEVYRLMKERVGNDWKKYEPYTNVLWLHYIVDKMLTSLRYRRAGTKLHRHYLVKLRGIKDRILGFASAAHFVLTDDDDY